MPDQNKKIFIFDFDYTLTEVYVHYFINGQSLKLFDDKNNIREYLMTFLKK